MITTTNRQDTLGRDQTFIWELNARQMGLEQEESFGMRIAELGVELWLI